VGVGFKYPLGLLKALPPHIVTHPFFFIPRTRASTHRVGVDWFLRSQEHSAPFFCRSCFSYGKLRLFPSRSTFPIFLSVHPHPHYPPARPAFNFFFGLTGAIISWISALLFLTPLFLFSAPIRATARRTLPLMMCRSLVSGFLFTPISVRGTLYHGFDRFIASLKEGMCLMLGEITFIAFLRFEWNHGPGSCPHELSDVFFCLEMPTSPVVLFWWGLPALGVHKNRS